MEVLEDTLAESKPGPAQSCEWMYRMIALLEAAAGQLQDQQHLAQSTLLEATALIRRQIRPAAVGDVRDARGRLLAWQARKVRDYIDSHITGPVLVTDLGALILRSGAHFSRSFKRTFGVSPHAFILRRRVALAAQYMLTTDAPLSDIASRCGFADQAHFCKQFRQATGETPAAWRRVHRRPHQEGAKPPVERYAKPWRNGVPSLAATSWL